MKSRIPLLACLKNRFIGKINNDVTGRELLKQAISKELTALQDMSAIENYDADDITVALGDDADSVVVTLGIQPVDAMEKLYRPWR